NQIVTHSVPDPQHLPMKAVVDEHGQEIHVTVEIAKRPVHIKAWQVYIGHITLYLLDTNVAANHPEDIEITYQLYGGDQHTRIKQEIILGIGGVRMLRQLGLAPTLWHINEGHAAFLILERLRELVHSGQPFEPALEMVAANTIFTTHTPVPAGHDHFPPDMVMHYLSDLTHELHISPERFLAMGCWPNDHPDFNMTTLALTHARHLNGVSRIHGRVSAEIGAKFWPEINPAENPMRYVTNGVHVLSVLAQEWVELFDQFLGSEWSQYLCDDSFWQRLENIPDQLFWNVKQKIKSRLLVSLRDALTVQHVRNQISQSHLDRFLKYIDPDDPSLLTIGFARRFATYKRATLLFNNLDWLRMIVNDAQRPIIFIFAGKAHPADQPGQELLRTIQRLSNEHEFVGKILLVQGYDLGLARRLVSGVDVWLNNPIYPLEASGTSGMKAAMNATLNLSVLDGWWAEGYDGGNGWAIKPSPHQDNPEIRDYEDARSLYELLQDEVIPLYYDRGKYGYSHEWVKRAKHSMATILPRFNTVRMLNDYIGHFYVPAAQQGRQLGANNGAEAKQLADWKAKIRSAWSQVGIRPLTIPAKLLAYGESVTLEVAVYLNQLAPEDVTVELLLTRQIFPMETLMSTQNGNGDAHNLCQRNSVAYKFVPQKPIENGEYQYSLTLQPEWCGGLAFCIRAFPYHALLTDPHEMGMMKWIE
ncbi:MAG: alpha-glucan family phosphorylase, partial [Pseudomonadota bacterium]|nr:alpha-glucan family phosphorylase [Pseudomonadota bacterium]